MGKVGRHIEGDEGLKSVVKSYSIYPKHVKQLEDLKKAYKFDSSSDVLQKLIEDAFNNLDMKPVTSTNEPTTHKENKDLKEFKKLYKRASDMKKTVTGDDIEPCKRLIQTNPKSKKLFPNKTTDEIYEIMEEMITVNENG